MSNSKENRPLTVKEKYIVYTFIDHFMGEHDKYPSKIIREDFDGDEDAYLRMMAKWHEIPL